ncbi:LysE family translocator [Nocardioidaceae bacterium SCSIO 66511]|nr:LysE family translocator [Nocardioidaceae bacterium SCSIO 66511]
MPVSSVVSFWLLAAVLIAVPGPDWAYAISAGLKGKAVSAAAGIVAGYAVMTAVVATGLGLVIASTPTALTLLTLAGGAYLIWLGIGTVARPAVVTSDLDRGGHASIMLQGMLVSGLNPKGMLIFVAMLPQFSDPDSAWPLPIQFALLGATFTLTCAVTYLCVGGAASMLLRARPSISRAVSRVSGASMVVVGALLLVERVV